MATDYELKKALPNKSYNENGTTTDLLGNEVINPVKEYENKPSLPNKWLNPDGSYSTTLELISEAIDTELFVVVEELPASGQTNKIYLLAQQDGTCVEYLWVNNTWDPVGMVQFDLSQYSTTEQMNAAIAAALNSAKAYADDKLAEAKSYTDGKLTDYVKDTDYASNVTNKAGVIKVGVYGTNVGALQANMGQLYCASIDYNTYLAQGINYFISKGTLENVITGKQLVNQTDLDTAIQTSITQVLGGSY